MDEVFAPVIDRERIEYLAMIIEDFLTEFKNLYPDRPLTPKMHYLVHIPTWIKWCGPLIKLWCMRYEAKHSFFKHISNILRNFRNIPKTLAARHQHYMCYDQKHQATYTGVAKLKIGDIEYYNKIILTAPELLDETAIWRARSATINGITYKMKQVIVCGITEEEPKFCQILHIYQTPASETLFVMCVLITTCLNQHYHAYEVVSSSDIHVYKYHRFTDHHPLHICKTYGPNRSQFVSLKYHISHV